MDINERIRQNLGLVYKQLHRFNLVDDPDAESAAYEALYKAIITYDDTSGNMLSTYATCIISNALRGVLRTRGKKRQLHPISLYLTTNEDQDEYILDKVASSHNVEDIICAKELQVAAKQAIQAVLARSSETFQKIINYWYDTDFKATQKEIADAVGITQATVSRTISNFKYQVKLELEDYL